MIRWAGVVEASTCGAVAGSFCDAFKDMWAYLFDRIGLGFGFSSKDAELVRMELMKHYFVFVGLLEGRLYALRWHYAARNVEILECRGIAVFATGYECC
jgi:hypothetical protein